TKTGVSEKNLNSDDHFDCSFAPYRNGNQPIKKKGKTMKPLIYSTLAVFTLACFALAQQAPDSVRIRVITTFDYPGAGNSTQPQKINNAGDIVGIYYDSSGVGRGFVRFANGNFSAPIAEPHDTGGLT